MPGSWRPHNVLQVVLALLCVQHSITEDDHQDTGQTYSTTVGRSVMLPCFISIGASVSWTFQQSDGSPTVDVYKDGAVIARWRSRAGIESIVDGDYSLVIARARSDDSGTYTCDVADGTIRTFNYTLVVAGSNGGPEVSVTAVVGSLVAFDCRIANGSLIRWHHNSSTVDKSMVHNGRKPNSKYERSGRFYFYTGKNRCVLFINGTVESDAGTFTCSPLHTALEANKQFTLSITGGSVRRPNEGSVYAELSCKPGYVCFSTFIAVEVVEAIFIVAIGFIVVVLLIRLCAKKRGSDRRDENQNDQHVELMPLGPNQPQQPSQCTVGFSEAS